MRRTLRIDSVDCGAGGNFGRGEGVSRKDESDKAEQSFHSRSMLGVARNPILRIPFLKRPPPAADLNQQQLLSGIALEMVTRAVRQRGKMAQSTLI